jgi:hypothetical protein
MPAFGLTGEDTIMIDSRILADFADADYGKVDFPNEIVNVQASKNGNVLIGDKASGSIMKLSLRIVVGSPDDKYLNSRLLEQRSDLPAFTAVTAMITKRSGDGAGVVANATYQAVAGVFTKIPGAVSSSEGSPEQSVAMYELTFGSAPRSIA